MTPWSFLWFVPVFVKYHVIPGQLRYAWWLVWSAMLVATYQIRKRLVLQGTYLTCHALYLLYTLSLIVLCLPQGNLCTGTARAEHALLHEHAVNTHLYSKSITRQPVTTYCRHCNRRSVQHPSMPNADPLIARHHAFLHQPFSTVLCKPLQPGQTFAFNSKQP